MNGFWSGWVKLLVVLNLSITLALFVLALRLKIPTQPDGTTGHVWAHGVLREAVRKLPGWWVALSVLVMCLSIVYFVLYPGFGDSKGVLGWTSTAELQRDAAANNVKLAAVLEPLRSLSVDQIAADQQSAALGHRLYLDNCAACHGAEARGNQTLGAPGLADADWQYGGDNETLLASIRDGRNGIMPAWGSALGHNGVNEVTSYVLSLRGVAAPPDWVAAGRPRFETICATCHGADGRGNPTLGAPNLTDDIWTVGKGDFTSIATTVRDGHSGVMPAWRHRLSEDEMRAIAAWVIAQGQRATGG